MSRDDMWTLFIDNDLLVIDIVEATPDGNDGSDCGGGNAGGKLRSVGRRRQPLRSRTTSKAGGALPETEAMSMLTREVGRWWTRPTMATGAGSRWRRTLAGAESLAGELSGREAGPAATTEVRVRRWWTRRR
ncbi:unnamed protein product [Linum trigynum]|uniref:Uncharacterized protein n=1 Tax=Linum trigynum TaxID=586398 RepID=A0AAV2FE82_9ROSI